MKVGLMQPYFFPYLGYFALIKAVDRFVLYDDASYIKNGWVNRNRIKIRNSPAWITVPVTNASTNYLINQVRIVNYADFKKRLFRTLNMNYRRAPSYPEVVGLLTDVFQVNYDYISDLNSRALSKVAMYLDIDTEILFSSHVAKDDSLRGEQKVIDICKRMNVATYINAIGGLELYSRQNFEQQGLCLKFIKINDVVYSQGKEPFVPNLSIIDVLMWNSRQDVKHMVSSFILIDG